MPREIANILADLEGPLEELKILASRKNAETDRLRIAREVLEAQAEELEKQIMLNTVDARNAESVVHHVETLQDILAAEEAYL